MKRTAVVAGVVAVLGLFSITWATSTSERARPAGGRPIIAVATVAAVSPGNLPDVDAAVVASQDAYYAEQQRQIDEYLAAVERERIERERLEAEAARAARPQTPPSAARASGPVDYDGAGGAAACIRSHEGWYTANTGNGFYGAYQFTISTWNATALRAGRPDLVGVLPSDASPADQDLLFWTLWADGAGARNWPVASRLCGY